MLDTCICSFIMREQPEAVLKRLEQAVLRRHRIVVSAITYAEMRFGCTGKRPRRAMPNWSMHSVVAWMPCWPGTGRQWMPPQRSVPYWPPPVRRLDQTMLLSPAMPLRPGRYWSLIT